MLSSAAVSAPRAFPSARKATSGRGSAARHAPTKACLFRSFGGKGEGSVQGQNAFTNPDQPPSPLAAPTPPPYVPPPPTSDAPPPPASDAPPPPASDEQLRQALQQEKALPEQGVLPVQQMQMRQLQPEGGQRGLQQRERGEPEGHQDPGWGERSYDINFLRERPVPAHLEESLPEAGQPSMVSRDRQHPEGDYPEAHMTPMQSHVAFFDTDGDGQIWPGDTYKGFRRLGFSRPISALGGLMIHGAFSYVTLPPGRWLPDPLFRVNINHIHKAKHGSDSETYDTEGRWVSQKFEEVFSKYGHTYDDALTWEELMSMTSGNKNAMDFFGWTAEKLEWGITFSLCARPVYEPDGPKVLRKDDTRGVLDGTLFYRIAEDLEGGKLQRRGSKEAGFKQIK